MSAWSDGNQVAIIPMSWSLPLAWIQDLGFGAMFRSVVGGKGRGSAGVGGGEAGEELNHQ